MFPCICFGRFRKSTPHAFERLINAVGPTGGKSVMKIGKIPQSVAIIHCVGSRDKNHHEYCSRVCCMYALKYDHLIKDKVGHNTAVFNFYIDMRCFGKGYEEFYRRVQEEGVTFVRGRPAEVTDQAQSPEEQGKLIVVGEDTLLGQPVRVPVDMVVLCTAMVPRRDAAEVARVFGISQGQDGFFLEEHPKLGPVSTATDGFSWPEPARAPRTSPTPWPTLRRGRQALSLAARGEVSISPTVSWINPDICNRLQGLHGLCAYSAIEFDERRHVSVINEAMCKGCGSCAGHCPSGAAQVRHFTERQLFAELEGLLSPAPPPMPQPVQTAAETA
jgi:heterodisulfide reductase subunit A